MSCNLQPVNVFEYVQMHSNVCKCVQMRRAQLCGQGSSAIAVSNLVLPPSSTFSPALGFLHCVVNRAYLPLVLHFSLGPGFLFTFYLEPGLSPLLSYSSHAASFYTFHLNRLHRPGASTSFPILPFPLLLLFPTLSSSTTTHHLLNTSITSSSTPSSVTTLWTNSALTINQNASTLQYWLKTPLF